MPQCPRFACATAFLLMSVLAGYAQVAEPELQSANLSTTPTTQPDTPSWQDTLLNLPISQYLESFFQWLPQALGAEPSSETVAAIPVQPVRACSVAPLDPISDPAAEQLELSSGSDGVVDIADMQPAAARALDRFQTKVTTAGGTIILKSAFRPAAYQRHLQDVWYKWMGELRNNQDPACQELKAQVQEEFTRHRLIETQHPVAVSDHTRGLAFDATVLLPPNAKIGRRRMTLDGLARLAGLIRPAIVADPVHFKWTGGGVRLIASRKRIAA